MSDKVFETLNALDLTGHIDKKKTGSAELAYVSWPWAWAEVKKRYPTASYEIIRDPDTHLPYSYDPQTGYMCYTTVTIEGITHSMWLPVMDSNNKAMKSEPYTVQTKYKTIDVAAATMFDINKTIMRCLVKNLAMFGLGLYIYAGEDLPEDADGQKEPQRPRAPKPEAQVPAPKDPEVHCNICDRVIEPYIDASGKTTSVKRLVERSRERFNGQILCAVCAREYIKNQGGN